MEANALSFSDTSLSSSVDESDLDAADSSQHSDDESDMEKNTDEPMDLLHSFSWKSLLILHK